MYELKKILPKMEIEMPSCMYILKNQINFEDDSFVSSLNIRIKGIKKQEATALDDRQEILLNRLKSLQQQLVEIRASLNMRDQDVKQSQNGVNQEILPDIVVNAHPNYVPYALLGLKNAWKDIFNISVKVYSHSTVSNISDEASEFQKLIETPIQNTHLPTINVTFIWKNCEHTELISSPTMFLPIYGEVNIIRFLGRIAGPLECNYDHSPLCNEIDAVLDICYQLLRCTTKKAITIQLRYLSNYLQALYFGGDTISLADVAVCSTLNRISQVSNEDLTINLIEWRERVKLITLM